MHLETFQAAEVESANLWGPFYVDKEGERLSRWLYTPSIQFV